MFNYLVVVSTDAIKRVVFAGVSATVFVVATEFLLSSYNFLLFLSTAAVLSFVTLIPIINHVRMFIAVRAHRNQVLNAAMSNQQAMILRREKKVAYHIIILIASTLIFMAPTLLLKAFQSSLTEQYRYLFPWTASFGMIKASVDPIINFWRNKALRNAMKSLVSC